MAFYYFKQMEQQKQKSIFDAFPPSKWFTSYFYLEKKEVFLINGTSAPIKSVYRIFSFIYHVKKI